MYIDIKVRDINNKIFTLKVKKLDIILHVKNMIFDWTGFHPDTQYLSFGGKKLEDKYKIWDYDIRTDSLINILIWQVGGF